MSFQDDVAARTIYGEARGESDAGKLAVAHVIRNRIAANRWGKTAAAVCLANMQFSCWNVNDPNRKTLLQLVDSDPMLDLCAAAWVNSMPPSDDPTKGSTHYKVVGTYARWAEGVSPVVVIGHHEFYVGIL